MNAHSAPTPATAGKSGPLRGQIRAPGDKSVSHRALIFGLLSCGTTEIGGLLEGADVLATARACAALGAKVDRLGEGHWRVQGVGVGALLNPTETLDFGNSGTGARLMMGVVAGHPVTARFDGDASLRKRPMKRVLDPLALVGARVLEGAEGGRLPLVLEGAREPLPVTFETPVPSAQVKSAVLLAGLAAPGETTVIEREATRDHTEAMLAYFGADVRVVPEGAHGRRITLVGRPELTPAKVMVPSDPSSAAFPLVAALLVKGSKLAIDGVMANPLRNGLVVTLREMGARIETLDERREGGEAVEDLVVQFSELTGVDVPAERAPSMIDEYPILAVAAAYARGVTRMRGLSELKVKESDRLAAVADMLRAAGVTFAIEGDDLIVEGRGPGSVPGGGTVTTHMDHRIAMSGLVLGLAAEAGMTVDDVAFIATSFPDFVPMMRRLGAEIA
ncbi:3-phosphoshikimate 1-carboxyvinyltransferase [Blastochloris viridis]|uniref:3-phosphoshikimate 1-carboxyvinyltransferase n=1 Tax=Blastochloris viridis TaxID=1079 RepID=A0A0H5BEH3_BLAVI|nr:3-phosphoshikimate 1-carboxyvinyltransferase [Blastochloris viridis]ALK10571.1 3-phosphoshikimate 1-carboxyvinyltransferase [Blastochloris viridis]BAR99474.1 5-Enolpyruvylshikimate-3-phosphate synthase [Blastochloris viridis]CUU43233.1 3-phosphoshikimate 1-carboxyvinyltransferase [Blastochloris viridis]